MDECKLTPDTIRTLRLDLGLTQSKLAVALGVTSTTVRLWEYGGMAPCQENKIKLRALKEKHDADKNLQQV